MISRSRARWGPRYPAFLFDLPTNFEEDIGMDCPGLKIVIPCRCEVLPVVRQVQFRQDVFPGIR